MQELDYTGVKTDPVPAAPAPRTGQTVYVGSQANDHKFYYFNSEEEAVAFLNGTSDPDYRHIWRSSLSTPLEMRLVPPQSATLKPKGT